MISSAPRSKIRSLQTRPKEDSVEQGGMAGGMKLVEVGVEERRKWESHSKSQAPLLIRTFSLLQGAF